MGSVEREESRAPSIPPEVRERVQRESLDAWREEGLLTAEQHARILARIFAPAAPAPARPATAAQERKLGRGVSILINLGAIILAAGLIIFFASNWIEFGRAAKIASLFALTLFFYLVGFELTQEGRWNFPKLGLALVFLGCVMFGVDILLLARIYDLTAEHAWSLLMDCAFWLAIAYLVRSRHILFLGLIRVVSWFGAEVGYLWGGYWIYLGRPFHFLGLGVAGRLVEGAVNPADGTVLALASTEPWGNVTVQLVQVSEDGVVSQRSPQIASERIVGFEAEEGALWVLAGQPASSPRAPFFVERMTLGGFQGPRLGPFASKPQVVLAHGQQVWVLEPEQHRVTRLDRTGRVEQEYRDVNRPTHMAVDQGALVVIEANQTQLSKFSPDGRALWKIPRFQGLAWILPEAGVGGGWVGAQRFENQEGGVFRYESDGRISRLPAKVSPRATGEWSRGRLAPEAVRDIGQGRIYFREFQAIVILGADGALLKRIEGFRYAQEQRVRK